MIFEISKRSKVAGHCILALLLIIANPAAGIVTLRYGMIAFGTIYVLLLAIQEIAYEESCRKMSMIAIGSLTLCEILTYFNGALVDPRAFTFRGICYALLLGGIAAGHAFRRSRATISPSAVFSAAGMIALAGITYVLTFRNNGVTAGRGAASDDFNPVGIAFNFGLLASAAGTILLGSRNRYLRALGGVGLVSCLVAIGSTGSRGALLSLFLSIVLFFFAVFKNVSSARKIGMLLGFALSVILIIYLTPMLIGQDQIDFLTKRLVSATANSDGDASMVEREALRSEYLQHFSSWWFFGFPEYDPAHYPHNIFLEMIIRLGLLGWVSSLVLVMVAIKGIMLLLKFGDNLTISLVVVPFVFNLLNAQTSLSIEHNRWLFFGAGFIYGVGKIRNFKPEIG